MSLPLILGGAAILLLASKSGRKEVSRKSSISCPPLSPGSGHIAGFDYIEFTTGGASLNERLPIVFFFHSLGSKPEGLAKHIQGISSRVRVVMPRGNEKHGSGPAWWTLRSKTEDQEGLADQMGAEGSRMARFVEEANHCLGGVGRPIVTGHSQGGMMTLAVSADRPEIAKAAIPVSGWLPVNLWPPTMPPTTLIHGTKDRTVDYGRSADFVARASGSGVPIDLIPIEDHGHGLGGDLKRTWIAVLDAAIQS